MEDGAQAEKKKKKGGGFQTMGLSYSVLKGILNKGYKVPTPIQRKSIPLILEGRDIVAMARTGSGKTAAFLVPLLERLKSHAAVVGIRGLILSPTRELAMQTMKFLSDIGRFTDLRAALLVGGESLEDQFDALTRNPDIVVATPGRLIHHIDETGMSLQTVEYLVFDEADRLFELGFADQLKEIISKVSKSRQTLLFSATMPAQLLEFSNAGLTDPAIVRLDIEQKLSDQLGIAFFMCRHEEKTALLIFVLKNILLITSENENLAGNSNSKNKRKKYSLQSELDRNKKLCMVFVSTKHEADYLCGILQYTGIESAVIHGAMDQETRTINLNNFRKGLKSVLLVTDVAARGIDIPLLDYVINFNFPSKPKLFVHRTGRVARAGRRGAAFTFVGPDEIPYMIDLHLFLGCPMQEAKEEDAAQFQNTTGSLFDSPALKPLQPYYGRIPNNLFEDAAEEVTRCISSSVELAAVKKVVMNADKLYRKTRQLASSESVKRAKELSVDAAHPLLLSLGFLSPQDLLCASEVLKLKSFRPSQTILEMYKKDPKQFKVSTVMEKKREQHDFAIWQTKQQKSTSTTLDATDEDTTPSSFHATPIDDSNGEWSTKKRRKRKGKFIDLQKKNRQEEGAAAEKGGMHGFEVEGVDIQEPEEDDSGDNFGKKRRGINLDNDYRDKFFIPFEKRDHFVEKGLSINESQTMDLLGDDEEGLRKNKQVLKWDRKRKRFIQASSSIDINDPTQRKKLRKDEAGNLIKHGDKDLKRYKEWQKKTNKKIPVVGEAEKKSGGEEISLQMLRKQTKSRYKNNSNKHEAIKNEIRSASEVEKLKKETELKKLKQHKGWKKSLVAKNKLRKQERFERKRKGAPSRSRLII